MKSDPGHDIFTVFTLGVHHRSRVDNLLACKIEKVSGRRGSTHIDSDTIGVLRSAGLYANDLLLVPDADRDAIVAVAQGAGKFSQGLDIHFQNLRQTVFSGQSLADSFKVPRAIFKGRFNHLGTSPRRPEG